MNQIGIPGVPKFISATLRRHGFQYDLSTTTAQLLGAWFVDRYFDQHTDLVITIVLLARLEDIILIFSCKVRFLGNHYSM